MSTIEPQRSAYSAALRLLAYRPRTRKEMASRLGRKFEPDVVDNVVALLTKQGYLDDASFASAWRTSRESNNPKSSWVVQRELETRGIEASVASETVQNMDDDENAYAAGAKAARRLAKLEPAVFRRRLWAYLNRRGFSSSVTRRTVERLLQQADEDRN
ncbi:MAG: regulatory protein RecX [SAR202 cluster bacterium]|nr:regulatory protein RecX [SAR202 cluster bacterium]